MPAMLSAIVILFPPSCRVTLICAAGLPSPAMMLTLSSVPSVTVATSRTRRPLGNTTAPISSGVCASTSVTTRYWR